MAARTTIAPDLAAVMRDLWDLWDGDDTSDRARAQHRALLRVARAAEKAARGKFLSDATRAAYCVVNLDRALDALGRVSGRQRKGGRP